MTPLLQYVSHYLKKKKKDLKNLKVDYIKILSKNLK